MTFYYAGVGSRGTPANILDQMKRLAARLEVLGGILRSGGADGADSAFESGCTQAQVFLPWPDFNHRTSPFTQPPARAYDLAAEVHPLWQACGRGPRALHARNCQQVLGPELDSPSLFVLCWTRDGAETEAQTSIHTGGTGQAIRLAHRHGIPVFNLYHADALARLKCRLQAQGIVE